MSALGGKQTFPPLRPRSAAALDHSRSSAISPVAILAIIAARPIASARRFSPLGPFGVESPSEEDRVFKLGQSLLQCR